MKVRHFESRDNDALPGIFVESVRAIPLGDYSVAQVEVWAAAPIDAERWLRGGAGRVVLVAEEGAEAAGFVSFEADGHIDHLYVHPRFQRKGAASALVEQIEIRAKAAGLARIFTEASITARPFFERVGFRVIEPQTVVKSKAAFVNFAMEKSLMPA
jgi:putative acetyltransferase